MSIGHKILITNKHILNYLLKEKDKTQYSYKTVQKINHSKQQKQNKDYFNFKLKENIRIEDSKW